MNWNLAAKVLAGACLVCGFTTARDLTGQWGGVADTTDEAGVKRQETQTLEKRDAAAPPAAK